MGAPRGSSEPSSLGDFLLDQVERHPADLVPLAASRFRVSRQAVHHHLNRLLRDGVLLAEARTRSRRYALARLGATTERLETRTGVLLRQPFLSSPAGISARIPWPM